MNVISSKDNSLVKNIIKLNKSAKQRREQQLFVAEGLRLCEDAMLSGVEIENLIVTENALNKFQEKLNMLTKYAKFVCMVSNNIFSLLSDTKTPQGVLCVIKTLDKACLFDKIKCNGKILALDNIQDPTNMGTILRTAEAIGIDGIVLSADCCDIYSPKVVRGSMGAVFRIPYIISDTIADFIKDNNNILSYASVVQDDAERVTDVKFTSPCIVAIGNEGNGLKIETIKACDRRITIPMNGRAESLNAAVAASILMWEMIK